MTFSADVADTTQQERNIMFVHNPTGVMINCYIQAAGFNGATPTPAQRDAVMQELLDKIVTLANVSIISAQRRTVYVSNATSP